MNHNFTTKNQNKMKMLLLSFAVAFFSCISMNAWGQTTETITSSRNWTVPTGVYSVTLEAIGGGGGGGGVYEEINKASAGGGGGAYAKKDYCCHPWYCFDHHCG